MKRLHMDEQIINRSQIDKLVEKLPTFYYSELARICFGRASKANRRKIKYWRTGAMADKVLQKNIFLAAQKLAQKHQAAEA